MMQFTNGKKLIIENGLELTKTWDEVFQVMGRRQISLQIIVDASSMIPQWISIASSESEEDLWEKLIFKKVGKSSRRSIQSDPFFGKFHQSVF